MSNPQDIIAWLVPKAHCPAADKAMKLLENSMHIVSCSDSDYLLSRIRGTLANTPRRAIQLSFTQPPMRHGRFILGTDASFCDIVLPNLPGISQQHCSIGFDSLSRLTIDDFSEAGTQVWYDWDCSGDQRDTSWILSSGYSDGFPNKTQCITIDIQGARFQIVVNNHSTDWDTFSAKVDALYEQPRLNAALDSIWELPECVSPLATLNFSSLPVLRHIVVKSLNSEPVEEIYVWDMERPWEPMVRASA